MCLNPQSEQFERSMEQLVGLGLAIGRGETSPAAFLAYAEALWNVRDLQATIAALERAIEGLPPLPAADLARAYASRSICHLQMENLPEATADATASLELRPNAHVLGLRAITLLHQGRHDEARRDVEEAFRLDPDDWEVRAWRGQVLLAIGRFAEARDDFTRVLEGGECHRYASELYLGRARASLALGDLAAVESDCNAAIEQDYHEQSHWPFIVRSRAAAAHTAYLLRAEARLALGQHARALGDCCFAASIAPGDAAIYELRARVYYAAGLLQESIRDVIRAAHLRDASGVPGATRPQALLAASGV